MSGGAPANRLAVVTAGLSQPSSTRLLGERLAAATVDALGHDAEVTHVDLRDVARDLTNRLLTGVASEELEGALAEVTQADGLVAVTPVFTGAYSGLFKTFFDVLDEGALRGVPVLLGATGGTPRHSLAIDQAMVPLFFALRAQVVPFGVYAATDDWGTAETGLADRITRGGEALARAIGGTAGGRSRPRDPYAEVTPFAELLGR